MQEGRTAEFWAHYGSCRILGPLWQLQNSGPTMAAAEFWAHYGSCRILGPLRQLQNFGPFLLRCLHSIPLWVNLFKHLHCVKMLKSKDYLAFIKWDDYWVGNLLFRSKLLNLKSNHERITLVAIYKRAPVPESLSFSLKKSGVSDLVMIWANCSQKTSDCAKKSYILYIFDSFTDFPFFMPKSELLPSLFAHCSFVKSNGSDLLS